MLEFIKLCIRMNILSSCQVAVLKIFSSFWGFEGYRGKACIAKNILLWSFFSEQFWFSSFYFFFYFDGTSCHIFCLTCKLWQSSTIWPWDVGIQYFQMWNRFVLDMSPEEFEEKSNEILSRNWKFEHCWRVQSFTVLLEEAKCLHKFSFCFFRFTSIMTLCWCSMITQLCLMVAALTIQIQNLLTKNLSN